MTFREIVADIDSIKNYIIDLSRQDPIPNAERLKEQLSRDRFDWELGGCYDGWVRFFPGRSVSELIMAQETCPPGCALSMLDSAERRYYQRFYSVDLLVCFAKSLAGYRKNGGFCYSDDDTLRSYYLGKKWNGLGYEGNERPCLEAISGLCSVFSDGRFDRQRTPALDEALRSECSEILARWKLTSPE